MSPLYRCSRCGTVDNTALSMGYWGHLGEKEVFCTECETGKWHGMWPKKKWDGKQKIINPPKTNQK